MSHLSVWIWLTLVAVVLTGSPIKHVIVLMEENRSFDHLFGFYTKTKVNGLTGKEYNLVDPTNPDSLRITVNALSPDQNPCDPDHGYPATSSKIFGNAAAKIENFTTPTMSGFVEWENFRNHSKAEYCGVMSMMSPEHVPIIHTLASEFAIMDRFFCSLPGPTWPNRLYALSATSAGSTETGPWYHGEVGNLFPQKTIFDQVAQANLTWKNYFNDTPWEMFLASVAHSPEHLRPMEEFWEDARTGNLPSFAWLNPRSGINLTTGVGSNDQHPDHDINAGEQYYKDVYEAIRSSPAWNETLFVITFDEHGGFYDHVAPPMHVPAPDNETSYPDSFEFDRLGVRIPTLLISPWIPKGTVISRAPAAQNPTPNSEYDLTSILSSARKLLGINLPPLTERDAWASTFEHAISEESPRTDCPVHLPAALPPKLSAHAEANLPLNDLQHHIATVLSHLSSQLNEQEKNSPPLETQGHMSVWAQHHMHRHRKNHAKNEAASLEVVCLPVSDPKIVEKYWDFTRPVPSAKFWPIQTKKLRPTVCLTVPKVGPNVTLVVVPCSNSSSPDEQSWVWMPDTTIRPALNLDLCIRNAQFQLDYTVRLTPCTVGDVNQHWGYHGPAAGNDGSGLIYFGDGLNGISLVSATQ